MKRLLALLLCLSLLLPVFAFAEDEEEDIFEDEEEEYDDYDDFSTSEGSFEERRDASLNMMDLNDL